MPITISQSDATNVVHIQLTGKCHSDDYDRLVPELETAIAQHGKLRLLVVMDDFEGWDAGGLWQDIKFDIKHFNDFDKIAMVGESKWQAAMTTFCKPFTTASIEYFDGGHQSVASNWLCKVS